MTTDERLDRLTERHEALTQHIELMQRDYEQRFLRIASTFETTLDSIRSLERISAAPEHRIAHLEGQ